MNRTLYSLIGYLLLPVLIFRLLVKSFKMCDYRQRIFERLAFIDKIPVPIIWIHCVSVGEFRAAIPLIDSLIKQYPNHRILATTTTPTGSNALKKHYGSEVLHLYFPFDLGLIVRRYIHQIKPDLCLLMETEIWPNLIHILKQKNIPTLLINARLSKRSLEKYQQFTPKLVAEALRNLTLIATQNQNSANRFVQLGAHENTIISVGNLKFDLNPEADKNTTKIFKKIVGKRKIITFASTHSGEEAQIIRSYLNYQTQIDALLIIIPRHPERFSEVENLIKSVNLSVSRRSEVKSANDVQFLLGDSMGEMMSYFEISDIVFMGGSLSDTGGHNMLEPAALSKAIIFGKNVFNFAEISADLLKNKASIQVNTADELFENIVQLLNNPAQIKSLGKNAKQYFNAQKGAVEKLMKLVNALI